MSDVIAPALVLGGAVLHECGKYHHPDGFTLSVSRDGLAFGSSEAVVSVVESLWTDGASVTQRATNAVTSFRVMVEGPDLTTLAAGERYVRRAFPADRGSTDLVWRPGEGVPAAVRTVLAGRLLAPDPDLYAETGVLMRRVYPVELTCAPFVRSEHETVVPALPVTNTETPVTIYSGGSPSAWSSIPEGKVETTVGRFYVKHGAWAAWYGSVPLGDARYLVVGVSVNSHPVIRIRVGVDGPLRSVSPTTMAPQSAVAGGVPLVYRLPEGGATLDSVQFPPRAPGMQHGVWSMSLWESVPTSERQSWRQINVGGTERSPGTLQVATRDGTGSLGTTIVHTGPDDTGYSPDLIPGRFTDNTTFTPDATTPGGGWLTGGGGAISTSQPVAAVPSGTYMVAAWLRTTAGVSSKTVTVSTAALAVGDDGPTSSWSTEMRWVSSGPVTLTTTPQLVWLGLVEWPGVDSGVGTAWILSTGLTDVEVGGWWAFPHGRDTSLTVVDSQEPHLWFASGDISRGPRVRIGATDDYATAYTPPADKVLSLDASPLPPGAVRSYVVTTGTTNAAVSYRYTKHWTHLPADDGTTS